MHYPLHLGVTEAGDGEDGRIKGAIGIGSLLLDGLGDTIRVSLTEDSVYEIPVARAIADKAMSLWRERRRPSGPGPDSIDPYHFERRVTAPRSAWARRAVGPEQPPRVIVRVAGAGQARAALQGARVAASSRRRPPRACSSRSRRRADLRAPAAGACAEPGAGRLPRPRAAPAIAAAAELEAVPRGVGPGLVLLRRFGGGDARRALPLGAASPAAPGTSWPSTPRPAASPASPGSSRALGRRPPDLHLLRRRRAGDAGHAARRLPPDRRRRCARRAAARPIWIRNTAGDRRARRQQLPLAPHRGQLPHRQPPLRRPRRPREHRDGGRPRAGRAPRLQCPAGRGRADLQDRVRRVPELRPHALRPADDDAAHPRADRRT